MSGASGLQVGEVRIADRATLELAHAAGDVELGGAVLVELQSPTDGVVVFTVPAGQTLVGEVSIVVAVGERGRLAVVAGKETLASYEAEFPAAEPVVAHTPIEVDGGAKGLAITVSTTGARGVVVLRGHVR